MVLVIVEYSKHNARMHKFDNREKAENFIKLVRNLISVVTAYITDRNKQYQWPTNLVHI